MSEPRPTFVLAVVSGLSTDPERIMRKVTAALAARKGSHQLAHVHATGASPIFTAPHEWTVFIEPEFGNRVEQARHIAAFAHGLLVVGSPRPWRAFIRAAEVAGKPVRVVRAPTG